MRLPKPLALALLTTALVGGWIGTVVASRQGEDPRPAALPGAHPPLEVLEAWPFVVDEPFVHWWRAERPLVDGGYLLVLAAEPELARTRQTFEPVLYVGSQTAERCGVAGQDGRMVVLVPTPLDADGRPRLDLATTPIWFGSEELPERVDARRIEQELAIALRAGAGPAVLAPDLRRAGDPIAAATRNDLDVWIEDLVRRATPADPRDRDGLTPR